MKNHIIISIATYLSFVASMVGAQVKSQEMEKINIGGLIVDSETLKPIKDAKIYDENDQHLTVTNSDGYFTIKLNYLKREEINFKLKIEKEDYSTLVQREHWGDNLDNPIAVYYIGLQHNQSKRSSFSEMLTNISETSFSTVKQNFESVKKEILLEEKIENAKKGNEKVFIEIDDSFYIVNNSGWIRLNTKQDNISINGEKVVPAFQINFLIKRKDVKGMTPIVSDAASFRIDANNN